MRRHWLIYACGVAALAAVFICWWGRDRSEPHAREATRSPAFSVLFQGYSNSVGGEKWALLTVTNRDSCDLHFLVPMVLVWSNNLGSTDEPTHVLLTANPLHPREACSMAVEVSMASGPWRFWCPVTRHTRLDDLQDRSPAPIDRWVPGSGRTMAHLDTGWRSQ